MSLPKIEDLTSEEVRKELAVAVIMRGDFIEKDARTYLLMKVLQDKEMPYLGGGNFPIASMGIACLEYLSIIHAILNRSTSLWSANEVSDWLKIKEALIEQKIVSKIKLNKLLKPEPKELRPKQAGDTVRELLQAFVNATDFESGLPMDNAAEFNRVWDAFRNHLVHTMSPAIGCSVTAVGPKEARSGGFTEENVRAGAIMEANPPFSRSENPRDNIHWKLQADLLAMTYVPKITDFLLEQVVNEGEDSVLRSALEFAWGKEFNPVT